MGLCPLVACPRVTFRLCLLTLMESSIEEDSLNRDDLGERLRASTSCKDKRMESIIEIVIRIVTSYEPAGF